MPFANTIIEGMHAAAILQNYCARSRHAAECRPTSFRKLRRRTAAPGLKAVASVRSPHESARSRGAHNFGLPALLTRALAGSRSMRPGMEISFRWGFTTSMAITCAADSTIQRMQKHFLLRRSPRQDASHVFCFLFFDLKRKRKKKMPHMCCATRSCSPHAHAKASRLGRS